MNGLRDAEMKSIGSVAAFHDFQFTDWLEQSGITFRHRSPSTMPEDVQGGALRSWKRARDSGRRRGRRD